MRILILSDLHNEFAPFEPAQVDADVVVLAGDIDLGETGVRWAATAFAGKEVIYVPGNHEYYGYAFPHLRQKLQALAKACHVHLLDQASVTIGGVRFLGCTLWTDFRALGSPPLAMVNAQTGLADYRMIRVSPQFRRLRPEDTLRWNRSALTWLQGEFKDTSAPTVVVTHHAPSLRSISAEFDQDLLNAAFASNLDELVEASGVRLWVHGHTHHCVDYRIGNTRVVSNQRGYPQEAVPGFNPGLVLVLDRAEVQDEAS